MTQEWLILTVQVLSKELEIEKVVVAQSQKDNEDLLVQIVSKQCVVSQHHKQMQIHVTTLRPIGHRNARPGEGHKGGGQAGQVSHLRGQDLLEASRPRGDRLAGSDDADHQTELGTNAKKVLSEANSCRSKASTRRTMRRRPPRTRPRSSSTCPPLWSRRSRESECPAKGCCLEGAMIAESPLTWVG
jgi:hypothetical protein